jgi:hypothetical protein
MHNTTELSYNNKSYITNNNNNNKKILELLIWCPGGTPALCRFRATSDACRHHVRCLLDSLPRSGCRCPERSDQDWSQLDGGVVASEAGEDILRHPPGNYTPFNLQEVLDAGLHIPQPLGCGVQDLEGDAKW